MNKIYEPDSQFVERLEWQLASEYRRANRLKPAAGKVAVPRRMVVVTLLVGVLLTGVAVIKAADYIKDSWRKKIEIARVETEVGLKKSRLESTLELASRAETRVSIGVIGEGEYQLVKLAAEKAALDLERSLLNRDEVKISGEAPWNELYAPVLGGRDFVSERLKVERKELERNLKQLERDWDRLKQMNEIGLVSGDELGPIQAEAAARKAMINEIQTRLDLRKRFVAGEVTAREVEIKDRKTVAESNLSQAQSKVDSLKERLEHLQSQEARGMISKTEVQQLRYALDAAQAELSLAALEKDVLEKVK